MVVDVISSRNGIGDDYEGGNRGLYEDLCLRIR